MQSTKVEKTWCDGVKEETNSIYDCYCKHAAEGTAQNSLRNFSVVRKYYSATVFGRL